MNQQVILLFDELNKETQNLGDDPNIEKALNKYEERISSVDPKLFIAYSFEKLPKSRCHLMFLYFPNLWNKLKFEDLFQVLDRLKDDFLALTNFISFVRKYFNIDLLRSPNQSKGGQLTKLNVYFKENPILISLTEIDKRVIEKCNIDLSKFEEIGKKYESEGGVFGPPIKVRKKRNKRFWLFGIL